MSSCLALFDRAERKLFPTILLHFLILSLEERKGMLWSQISGDFGETPMLDSAKSVVVQTQVLIWTGINKLVDRM